jgi:hypothetical protein
MIIKDIIAADIKAGFFGAWAVLRQGSGRLELEHLVTGEHRTVADPTWEEPAPVPALSVAEIREFDPVHPWDRNWIDPLKNWVEPLQRIQELGLRLEQERIRRNAQERYLRWKAEMDKIRFMSPPPPIYISGDQFKQLNDDIKRAQQEERERRDKEDNA